MSYNIYDILLLQREEIMIIRYAGIIMLIVVPYYYNIAQS